MIYFDNAATSWPKPPEVLAAVEHCLKELGANPGRSGHTMSVKTNHMVTETRELLAWLFNIQDPERIIFTFNATDALNLALKGLFKAGDHVITSSMEHNSVTRPLHTLAETGVEVTKIACAPDGSLAVADVEQACRENTRALVFTHASNVTGTLMPLAELGQLARSKGLVLVVDAAQTAGLFEIDATTLGIGLLAFPGHKGLLGPPGTGGLYIREDIRLRPFREGGTGSHSETAGQPEILPERYESGTMNTPGIAGLGAGLKYIRQRGRDAILAHEQELTKRFLDGASGIKGLKVYGPEPGQDRAPVVSFELPGKKAGVVGQKLDQDYHIAARAGLHCAPDAHHTLGTFDQKLIRFSFSCFNQPGEIDLALKSLAELAAMKAELFQGDNAGCKC